MTAKRKKTPAKQQPQHPLINGVGPWLLVTCFVLILAILGLLVYIADEAWKNNRIPESSHTYKGVMGDEAERIVKVTGKVVCLPKIDTGGPQTMECALGIETKNGLHYGVTGVSDIHAYQADDQELTVKGKLTAPEHGNTYDIEGVIATEE